MLKEVEAVVEEAVKIQIWKAVKMEVLEEVKFSDSDSECSVALN